MVKKEVLIISIRGYTFKYIHGRLILISMGADNLQYICTQHRSGIRIYATLVA